MCNVVKCLITFLLHSGGEVLEQVLEQVLESHSCRSTPFEGWLAGGRAVPLPGLECSFGRALLVLSVNGEAMSWIGLNRV